MAENNEAPEIKGIEGLKKHVKENPIDIALWATRIFTILFTVGYFIPLFWNPQNLYYKALLSNAATSALRLHQRIPAVQFSREYLQTVLLEDCCHYMVYSLIFFYLSPVTMVLLPLFLYAILHSASYSLTLLDVYGQNAWWGARLLISLVEFQSRNILRLVSFTEIFLMPFTILIIFFGRGNILTPFIYYHFLTLRYSSRRNPYTRNMFHELRVVTEGLANNPMVPDIIRRGLLGAVSLTCRLAPPTPPAAQ